MSAEVDVAGPQERVRVAAPPDADDASTGASEGLSEAEREAMWNVVVAWTSERATAAETVAAFESIVAARVSAAATRAADDRAERIAQAIEGHGELILTDTGARLARETP